MKKIKHGSHIRKDIPLAGWTLLDCIDGMTADHRCAACGYPKARFVHKLSLLDFEGAVLLAGFVCAGQLTEQPDLLRLREGELKRLARMRAQFLKRGWSSYNQDNGLGLALRREAGATFMAKEQTNATWTLYRTGREIGTTLISEGHPSRGAAVLALFRVLHEKPGPEGLPKE